MKIIILQITLLIISASIFAQQDTVFIKQSMDWTADTLQYKTDTVLFESGLARNFLIGTTVLSGTHNQIAAQGYGLYLNKVSKTDCQNHGEEVYHSKDRINTVELTDTTLTVDITVFDNCCYDFLCDATMDEMGNLSLIYHGYGNYCFCDCCFGLVFHFIREMNSEALPVKSVQLLAVPGSRQNIE